MILDFDQFEEISNVLSFLHSSSLKIGFDDGWVSFEEKEDGSIEIFGPMGAVEEYVSRFVFVGAYLKEFGNGV